MAVYSDADLARGQRAMILEGVFSRAMDGLTGGVVLAALALHLGASDVEIGLLAAIPFLAQLAHIPAIVILSRAADRRAVTVWPAVAGRLLFLLVALLPIVAPAPLRVPALLAVLAAYAVLLTLSGAAWQVWLRDLVPRASLGAYHGRRSAILAGVGFVTLLLAGQFLARWRGAGETAATGFAVLYVLGTLLGLVSAAVLARAPSLPSAPPVAGGLRASLRRPFASRNYRRVLVFLGAWGFAANLALPFVAVVLIRTVGYGLGVVTGLAALSLAANYLGFRAWGPLVDRYAAKPVLAIGATLFVLAMGGWAILPKEQGFLLLAGAALVHVVLGLATSGLDLASTALVMKIAPNDDAPAYLSTASLVKAVTTGVAPLVGGVAATLLAGRAFTVSLSWTNPEGIRSVSALALAHHDFLFLGSVLLGLYSIHRLLGFEEEGEAPPEEVVRALRRDVSAVASVAGMRQFAHIGSYIAEAAERRVPRRRGRGARGRGDRPEPPAGP